MIKFFLGKSFYYVVLLLFLFISTCVALAAPPQMPQAVITEVLVVFNPDTLFIKGRNFGNGSPPTITLGENPEPLTIISFSETEIVAECPPDTQQIPICTDGDYLLKVSVGKGIMDNDVYPLTIGAVGPQGEIGPKPEHQWIGTSVQFEKPDGTWGASVDLKGETGDQGPQGIQGIQGPVGPEGPKGDKGTYGLSCEPFQFVTAFEGDLVCSDLLTELNNLFKSNKDLTELGEGLWNLIKDFFATVINAIIYVINLIIGGVNLIPGVNIALINYL